jgi:hypothetical protein
MVRLPERFRLLSFPDYIHSKMRLSGCTGKTLGRPPAVRGRTSGL